MKIAEGYLAALDAAEHVLGSPDVANRWKQPSALAGLSVGGLAGHLAGGVSFVEERLDKAVPPDAEPMTAAAYLAAVSAQTPAAVPDIHASLREQGEARGRLGPAGLQKELRERQEGLRRRLNHEAATRPVKGGLGHVLPLDQFLLTQVVEVVVHVDDLATDSPGLSSVMPSELYAMAVTTLLEAARLRSGDRAVLRALTRRERDHVEALRMI